MPRTKTSTARRAKHKRTLKKASGFYGRSGRVYKLAKCAVNRAGVNATRDRRLRKRDFRRLWITRVHAACEQRGIRYSEFIHLLDKAGITLNRKMLSEIAIADPAGFDAIVALAVGAR